MQPWVNAEQPHAQGELYLARAGELFTPVPNNAVAVAPVDGRYIIGHSETGHHHTVAAGPGVDVFEVPGNPWEAWINTAHTAELRHERDWDTHETIALNPGWTHVRRDREYVPEGFRKAQD
jgi:hypothetical protein